MDKKIKISEKLYQHNYYLSRIDILRRKHRAYALMVRKGEKVVVHKEKHICRLCGDNIFGPVHTLWFNGKAIKVDDGCRLLIWERQNAGFGDVDNF